MDIFRCGEGIKLQMLKKQFPTEELVKYPKYPLYHGGFLKYQKIDLENSEILWRLVACIDTLDRVYF